MILPDHQFMSWNTLKQINKRSSKHARGRSALWTNDIQMILNSQTQNNTEGTSYETNNMSHHSQEKSVRPLTYRELWESREQLPNKRFTRPWIIFKDPDITRELCLSEKVTEWTNDHNLVVQVYDIGTELMVNTTNGDKYLRREG